ncbi:hypothetical protein [Paludibacterium purpuratum]|uniref:Uncharacterized protein n=1 Tax=Paludibacterium purpuratum TaxID=1144873 RepID=A0A4R7B7T6_9NEIS|nr:hypothetical protein [Paludibacterium purpuratum]TDR79835.1 hypothetical protein DFP86_107202 [Paludibacterium purpuratum]
MWMSLLLFVSSLFGWWGLLWLGLPVSWQRISPSAILLIHAVPPVLIFSLAKLWLGKRKERAAAADEQRKQAAEAERLAALATAREQHRAALAVRREPVECRWAGLMLQGQGAEAPAWLDDLGEHGFVRQIEADELEGDSLSERLTPALTEWFTALYEQAPGAAALPLLLEPCPALAGGEQLQWVRKVQLQVLDSLAETQFKNRPRPREMACRFLPGRGLLAERLITLFEQDATLPGATVLAFDAAWADSVLDDEPASQGAAVAGLLFLRANLPQSEPAADVPAEQNGDNAPYQAYWQKPVALEWAEWGTVPPWAQEDLLTQPKLAALARGAHASALPTGVIGMSKVLRTLLDEALINGSLRDLPFADDEPDPQAEQAASLAWLVHDGGSLRAAGGRMAALGSLLSDNEVELSPIDDASNLVRDCGVLGSANDVALDACAALHAARLQAPVLLAHFVGDEASLSVTRPPLEENV